MSRRKKTQSRVVEPKQPGTLRVNFKPIHQEQVDAIQSLKKNAICFLTGPAGSSKTFVATAWALRRLLYSDIKMIISRPAIQQGANIGFLPGTPERKISPFMRPIHDSIDKLLGSSEHAKAIKRQVEILPLSFIRGMTISDATLVVDEAQNLSRDEILAVSTRIGEGGQIIFCGDISQNDMAGCKSRLADVAEILDGGEADGFSIGWHKFSMEGIVRHPLVKVVVSRMAASS